MATDPSKTSQCEQILLHLKSGKSITPIEALNQYGIMRLGARIYDLRNQGYDIESEPVVKTSVSGTRIRYARYSMPATSGRGADA